MTCARNSLRRAQLQFWLAALIILLGGEVWLPPLSAQQQSARQGNARQTNGQQGGSRQTNGQQGNVRQTNAQQGGARRANAQQAPAADQSTQTRRAVRRARQQATPEQAQTDGAAAPASGQTWRERRAAAAAAAENTATPEQRIAAAAAAISIPEDDHAAHALIADSPFMSKAFKERIARSESNQARNLAFRGFAGTEEGWLVNIYNNQTRQAHWVKVGEELDGMTIAEFDRTARRVKIIKDSTTIFLPLERPH